MLDTLKKFFADIGTQPAARFEDNDYRLAAAAILVHVISVDGAESDEEHSALRTVLKSRFELDDPEIDELVEAATQADRNAIDLYQFTSLLNRTLDEDGRLRIVEMMWQLVYADGRVNEFEDNVIWRAADLLGISSRQRITLRRRVAGDRAVPDRDE
jgi:uncharacterized tellurite resistance protein B-like protein